MEGILVSTEHSKYTSDVCAAVMFPLFETFRNVIQPNPSRSEMYVSLIYLAGLLRRGMDMGWDKVR
jgi:hypothetical protein